MRHFEIVVVVRSRGVTGAKREGSHTELRQLQLPLPTEFVLASGWLRYHKMGKPVVLFAIAIQSIVSAMAT